MDYMKQDGVYQSAKSWILPSLKPHAYWALFPDNPLSQFATIVAHLPASSASVERVWSAMNCAVASRENLTTENLAKEAFVRFNRHLLNSPASPQCPWLPLHTFLLHLKLFAHWKPRPQCISQYALFFLAMPCTHSRLQLQCYSTPKCLPFIF